MPEPASTATLPANLIVLDRAMAEAADERDFVYEFVDASDALRSSFVDVWDEILDNYFVTPFGESDKFIFPNIGSGKVAPYYAPSQARRATLKDPETHQVVESLVAQGLGLIFSSQEYIQVIPVGADDVEKARLLQRLITAALEQPGNFRTFYQLFKDSFLLGTAIVQIGWDTRSRTQMVKKPQFDDLGLMVGYGLEPQEVVYRDAPLIELVDIYDFYADPSGTRIQRDMSGVTKRFRITPQTARDLAGAGVYNRGAVERVLRRGQEKGSASEARGGPRRFDDLSRDTAKGLRPLTGFEYWGRVPYRTSDGATNRVVTVLEGEVVRSHINPFIDGAIPFKEVVVNPVSGRFYGLSPAEVIRYLQDSADNMLMVANDAADLMTRMPLLVGAGFGGDPLRLKARKFGDVIPCANADTVKPVPVDFGALKIAVEELTRRKTSMREAAGVTDPMQSIPSSDRKTATEISELVRLASQRVELMAKLIEREDLPWIGRTLHARLRQFLDEAGALTTLNGEPLRVPFDAIDFDADVRFVGSQQATSKFQQTQSLSQALTILGTNPQVAAMYPDLVERLLESMGIPDAEAIVKQAQAIASAQMMAAAGGGPGGGAGGAAPPRRPAEQPLGTETGAAEREGRRMG